MEKKPRYSPRRGPGSRPISSSSHGGSVYFLYHCSHIMLHFIDSLIFFLIFLPPQIDTGVFGVAISTGLIDKY